MEIALNIGGLLGGAQTGVQNYGRSLLAALRASDIEHCITALRASDIEHCITALVPQVWSPTLLGDAPPAPLDTAHTNCFLPPSVPGATLLNNKLLHPLRVRLPRLTEYAARRAAARYDLLHTPAFSRPEDATYRARRNVCTLFDMTARTHAWAHSAGNRVVSEAAYAYARTCDRVLTISEHSKEEIGAHLDIPADRIDVTPLAPRAGTRPVTEREELDAALAPFGLDSNTPFALYAGTLEPRKNLPRLLCAWACVSRELPQHVLVLAGGAWPGEREKLEAQAAELGVTKSVVSTGYVDGHALNALMSACAAFVYVSESEGFGLPPLEAMACGAPVICSNTSSLPEVAGNAGLLVDPANVDEIVCALHHLLTDKSENTRRRALSGERAAQFTWAKTAQLTWECYARAAQ